MNYYEVYVVASLYIKFLCCDSVALTPIPFVNTGSSGILDEAAVLRQQ